jgi:hypothetical protein
VLLILVLGGLAIIGFFALRYFQQQQLTQGCNTPESCLEQANQYIVDGKPGLALPALNQGIDLAPDDAHPAYARLVCRRGDVNLMLERNDLVVRDFTQCIEWTEDDPDLQDLRDYAREKLKGLKQ